MIRFLGCILLISLFGGTHTAYGQEGGGSLGVRVGEVTDTISRAFGLTEPTGAIVHGVDETGPARSAGVQPGDLITKLNDRNIREYRELAVLVKKVPPGTNVNLTIVRLGQEQIKTVIIRNPAPALSIRTPECEEYLSVNVRSDSPMTIQALFGKLAGDMTLAELDQGDAAALRCEQLAAQTSTAMRLRSALPMRVRFVRRELGKAKRARLDDENRAIARDQTIFQSRLEEERKNTDAKAKAAASAKLAKAIADECRNHCREKLLAMLDQLRSLEPNAASIDLIRELRRDHQALVQQMPPDVSAALSALNDTFVREYKERSVSISKMEQKLKEEAVARDAKIKETNEKVARLQPLYFYYMIMQVCAERYREFTNTTSGMRGIIKNLEAGLPADQAKETWNAMAEKFRKMEDLMKMRGDAQLYTDCDQTRESVAGLMLMPGLGGTTPGAPPRKRDF